MPGVSVRPRHNPLQRREKPRPAELGALLGLLLIGPCKTAFCSARLPGPDTARRPSRHADEWTSACGSAKMPHERSGNLPHHEQMAGAAPRPAAAVFTAYPEWREGFSDAGRDRPALRAASRQLRYQRAVVGGVS